MINSKLLLAGIVSCTGLLAFAQTDPSPSTEAASNLPVETAAKTTESWKNQKFTGSPITIKLKEADVQEVLRLIGDTSGFNIVIHPSVQGKLTLSLENVPWDQALEIVLSTLKLAAERNESVLRVLPRDMLISEKQQELDSKKLILAAAPRVTRVFPISYADINQLSSLLQQFASSQSATGSGSPGLPSSTIIVDNSTQSLIIRDTVENIDKFKKMIELLDVQTPQVLIEAKVVEASEDFSKSINGQFSVGGSSLGVGFNGQTNLLGTPVTTAPGNSSGASAIASSVTTLLGKSIALNAQLSIAENQNKIKVVSSPRTVVLSGKSSSITQTKTTAVKLTTPGTAQNPATQQITQVSANTRLSVTPRVTNDGSVFMRLDLSRDILRLEADGTPAIEPRVMNTEVIVESGNTLVIGGVLNIDETSAEGGIPFLRKIPILGSLFGNEKSTKTKSELMFFITPRVLNQKKTMFNDEDSKKL